MKKNIMVYVGFAVIYAVISVVLTSSMMSEVNILLRFVVNLAVSSCVYIFANLILNYKRTASSKRCLGHALSLAILACIIALGIGGVQDDVNTGSPIVSESKEEVSAMDETGVNDVQMDIVFSDHDTSSRIVQIILDTLIAFFGGVIGMNMYKKRNENHN